MSIASVLTIYPTALKVEEVLKAHARVGDVSLGARVTTFPELIDALDREDGAAPPIVSEALAVVLVHDAVIDAFGDRERADRPGIAHAALRALGELRAACLDLDAIEALAAASTAAETRRRLQWLARVAAGYARRLAAVDRADRHDRERRVLAALHRHQRAGTRPRALAGVDRLVIAEIYDYSPVQSLIARAMIGLVGDAELVTLAHPENVDASRFVERTWNRFVEDPTIADKVLPDFVVRGGRGGALARVLATLFQEPKSSAEDAPADESVAVLAAASRVAEVEEIGRRIRAALVAGVAPGRLAILARDLASYRPILEDVARRYRLPLVIAAPRALTAHTGVQAVLRLVRTVSEGLPAEALRAALESPYFTAAPVGVAPVLGAIGYVDAATCPLPRCLANAVTRLELLAGAEHRERSTRALDRIRRDGPGVTAAVDRLTALDASRTLAAHAAALLDLLADLGLTASARDPAPGEATSEGAALDLAVRALADIAALPAAAGTHRVSLPGFLARLTEALDALDVEGPGPHADGVRALAIADARGLDFDAVFLVGLDDGTFPSAAAEDPLLDDAVRRDVNRHAPALLRAAFDGMLEEAPLGRLLRTSADRTAEDPFLFYLALSTAEQRVLITYPRADEQGRALVRSPFIDEVVAILGARVLLPTAPASVPQPTTCGDGHELLHAGVLAAADGQPGLLAAVGARLPRGALRDVIDRIRTERRRARYFLVDRARDASAKEALADAWVGRLPADAARRERLAAMEWSASRLDELGACGFKFFAHRLLYLQPEEAPTEALDAREQGTLAHRLLEAVLRRCDPLPRDLDAAVALARAVADEQRAAIAAEIRDGDPRLFDLAWTRAVEALVELVRLESAATESLTGTRRRRLEWPFRVTIADHRGSDPAARLDVTLTGIVDRADLWIDGDGRVVAAQIVDYKNGKRESEYAPRLDAARDMGRTSFQVPVYALALRADPELEWAPDAPISAGFILLRSDRKVLVRPLPAPLLIRDPEARRVAPSGTSEPIANRIVELVASAADGRFDVEPRECSPFCDYRLMCRYEPPPEEGE